MRQWLVFLMEPRQFRFGGFEFEVATRQLWRDGARVSLQTQPARVLGGLLRRAGQVVSRDELSQAVWGGETFVDFENGLNFCISQVRSALRDSSAQSIYIRTIPKIGYQFIAPVEPIPNLSLEERNPIAGAGSPVAARTLVLALAIGLFAVLTLAARYSFRFGRGSQELPIVAVLRFDNETGNPDLLRFSDGLTDNTVEQLTSQSRGRYSVIGNAQILRRPRDQRDLTAIATSLHASYVVLGQVQANNSQVRILAHLIHLPEQTHVWVARMDRTLVDPLSIESDAAREIAGQFSARVLNNPLLGPSGQLSNQ
jgi:DNA-binding winged helix-turn-helix (wHTH) protein/TolB-like protein